MPSEKIILFSGKGAWPPLNTNTSPLVGRGILLPPPHPKPSGCAPASHQNSSQIYAIWQG